MSFVSNNTFGVLSSAQDGKIVEHIYGYVYLILQSLNGTTNENENSITDRLCKMLEYKKPSEYPYFFHHQNIENNIENTSTDFAAFGTFAYTGNNIKSNAEEIPSLVKFEAKRLSSMLPKNREREYVIGEYEKNIRIRNSGGIERFKNERHGKDVTNACLIGYVQTDSLAHWIEKVNSWIQDEISNSHDKTLLWDKEDILKKVNEDSKTIIFSSCSSRLSLSSIELRHIWIVLT